ncbi:NAD(P)-binding protein [Fistulina hepatica ATCC 64428]|uniref:NAD(P)-binding protein n=1 Tax=Fistulina hepatica ATCC 64428 TaxID=1128425 RepID=A0A0D7ABV8_9AGAR|nr:NAD(P)-binding protein [Fistulina hepatica ATCC 64428]
MGKLSYWRFILNQWTTVPAVVHADLTGKTVVVIGANVGIGLEAVKHFAWMHPAHLILGCRDVAKGNEAAHEIVQESHCDAAVVDVWSIDLAEFASVECERLDLLILNAGMIPGSRSTTVDGWETCLQVNDLSFVLLSLLLLPLLLKTTKESGETPRIVTTASDVHYWTSFDDDFTLQKLSSDTQFKPGIRYHDSKLLNVLFVHALNDRLRTSGPTVIVNAVNPGFCISQLHRNVESLTIRIYVALFAISAEKGSRAIVWTAITGGEDADELRGGYIDFLCTLKEPSDFVLSTQGQVIQNRVWDEVVEMLSSIDARVPGIVRDHLVSV